MKRKTMLLLGSILALGCGRALAGGGNQGDGTYGPYLQMPADTSMVVRWRTAPAGTSELEWGTSSTYGAASASLSQVNYHRVKVTGLKAATLYHYRARTRAGGALVFSETGTFRTLPAPGAPFTFVHMSETHDEDEVAHFKEEILAARPAFIIDAGDQVDEGGKVAEWDRYFTIGEAFYRHVPAFLATGNHNYEGGMLGIFGSLRTYKRTHSLPGNEEWYTVRQGNTLFIILNSTWYFDPWRLSTTQISWLKKTLAAASRGPNQPRFKVAVFHAPPYSSGPWYRNFLEKPWVRWFFVRNFRKYKVDLVLNAHDKFNEHSVVDGIHYVQCGTGAITPKRVQTRNPHRQFLDAVNRAILITDVAARQMDCRFVDTKGKVLHRFTIKK